MPAKPGNTNALKHGLYARRFHPGEISDLRKMPFDDLRQEIALLRVTLNRLAAALDTVQDPDTRAKLSTAATTTALAIGTLARSQALLTGNYAPLDDALQKALQDTTPYL